MDFRRADEGGVGGMGDGGAAVLTIDLRPSLMHADYPGLGTLEWINPDL